MLKPMLKKGLKTMTEKVKSEEETRAKCYKSSGMIMWEAFAELRGSESLRLKVWGREPEYLSSNSASAKLGFLEKIINI